MSVKLQVRIIAASAIVWSHGASCFPATPIRQHLNSPSPSLHRDLHDRTGPSVLAALPPHHNANEELHLVTFDLDDTIFPIGPVVADANAAQRQTLIEFGYENACNDEIIAASKRIRAELREAGDAITYTDLRKRSIRREIRRLAGGTEAAGEASARDSAADAAFDAWLSERHASADRNLYPGARRALGRIRERHPAAVIGAITNGRGNPLEMPLVASYFDFCVSGEDEGVFPRRKPDKGIYEAAVRKYNEMRREGGGSFNWIHIGDDLANDVGASAACGAKTIWCTLEDEDGELPSWSTATEEELQRRVALDEAAKGLVNARISRLDELPGAIVEVLGWQERSTGHD